MNFKRIFAGLAGVASIILSSVCLGDSINGAGATFPAPLYQQWIAEYSKISGIKINYQGLGSSAGLAQIKQKTVDFGASDEPLQKEALDKDGLIQFPMIMGAIVPVVNIPNIKPGEIKLSGQVLAKIFMGKITSWNDSEIAKLNEGLKLPDLRITVIHRADGSGTTWNFTNYLSKVSKDWADNFGCNKEIAWFEGSVGGQKNAGVAAMVKRIKGAIGYVEAAYAFESNMTYTQLQNKAGKFVQPANENFQAAAANADWNKAPAFYMVLTDQPGDLSWPIMASSYILIYKDQTDGAKAEALLNFFSWAYNNGENLALKLNYVPMPKNVADMVRASWERDVSSNGSPVLK